MALFVWRCVRCRAMFAIRLHRPSRSTPLAVSCFHIPSSSMAIWSSGPDEITAPLIDPIEVPTTMSGRISASANALTMPTSAAPRRPPPPNTKATRSGVLTSAMSAMVGGYPDHGPRR